MGTYLVMKNNLKRSFHHKLLFTFTFLIPVILCLMIGMVRFGKTTIRVGILGIESGVMQSDSREELFQLLDQSKGLKYEEASEKSRHTDLMTGKYQIILDYRESDAINQFQLLSYQTSEKSSRISQLFQQAFTNKEPVMLTEGTKEGLTNTERIAAVLLSLFMVFSTVYASEMIKDRQNGTILRYRFANTNELGYTLGYMAHNFVITLLQVILCMTVLTLVQDNFNIGTVQGLILSVIIAGISSVFSLLVCLGSKSEVQANITASALAAILSLLGGTFVAVESMPGLLRILSGISPIRWIMFFLR